MSEELADLGRRLVIGHKRDGRSIYDAQAKRELIEACLQPGVSLARVARGCGVNANQLATWVRERRRTEAMPAATGEVVEVASAFVPVQVEAQEQPRPRMTMSVQARLPNGVIVDLRECELDQTDKLLQALGEDAVFRFDEELKVYLHRAPIDFRAGINSLAVLVEQALGFDPFAPALYVFGNRRRDRVKILGWDRNGYWLLLKRLEADRFIWPDEATIPTLTVEQLHWLLEGIDVAVVQRHPQRLYARVS